MTGQPTALYLRISNDQEGQELGVIRQYEDLVKEAIRAGDAIVGPEREVGGRIVRAYVDNDISASTLSRKRRPDYSQLVADAKAGEVRKVRAYTAARLTRRPREFEDLIELAQKHGVEYAYIRSPSFDLNTAQGRQVARTLAAGDAAYPEIIGELVQRKKQEAKNAGLWLGGGRPFGYERDGMTVRDSEAKLIDEATHHVLAGGSFRSVAEAWSKAGMPTTTWHPPLVVKWTGNSVRDVLTRPRNVAQMGKVQPEGKAAWPAIVDRDAWDALRAMVADNERPGHSTSRKLLGSFLFRCGGDPVKDIKCGSILNSGGTTKSGKPRYRCPACGLQRLAQPVDNLVLAVQEADLRLNGAGLMPKPTSPVGPLRKRLTVLRQRASDIAAEFGDPDSGMTREQFRDANKSIQEKIKEVKAELERVRAGSVFSGIADAEDPVKAFLAAGQDRQRAIIDARWNVVLMRVGRGRKPFDPESVVITPKE